MNSDFKGNMENWQLYCPFFHHKTYLHNVQWFAT